MELTEYTWTDSPAFNPSLYYDDLISKSSLSGLMKSASSLSAGWSYLSHPTILTTSSVTRI